MLQILRSKAQSPFIQAIVVIIALVFIFWGVGTNMMNNREAALLVNGEEISFQQFQNAYDQAYQNLANQFQGNVPKGLAEALNIKQQVINQLVQETLLRQGAEKMGIVVSQDEIQKTITEMVQFQGTEGFSMERYTTILSANRQTPTTFEDDMRYRMLAGKTANDIARFAAISSDYEVEERYRQANEKVAVKFSRISPEKFQQDIVVDDEALATWFEGEKENYLGEKEMKLKYLPFTYDLVGSRITIDDEQINNYYDQNLEQFSNPELRRARHILLRAGEGSSAELLAQQKKKASEILILANTGTDFAELAMQFSDDSSKENGGDLGLFSRGQMVPAFDEAVFTMQPGDISEVVQTQFGYHIIKLEEIQPAATRTLAESKERILALLQKKEAQPLAFQMANSAYEGIIGAGSLQAYVDATPDQEIISTDYFPRSAPPRELALDGEFLDRAFVLSSGELSSLTKTNLGYYIIFAEDIKEPEAPSLTTVKEAATADYIAAKSMEEAEKTAKDMLTRLHGGEPFDELAAEAGLMFLDSGLLSKDGAVQTDFPAALLQDIFTLSPSSPFPENPALADGSYYIFSFANREFPEIVEKDDLVAVRESLLREKQNTLLTAYLAGMQKDAEITQHPSL